MTIATLQAGVPASCPGCRRILPLIFLLFGFAAGGLFAGPFDTSDRDQSASEKPLAEGITLRIEGELGPPALFGLTRLKSILSEKGLPLDEAKAQAEGSGSGILLIGTLADSPIIRDMKDSGRLTLSSDRECLAVKHLAGSDTEMLIAAGADDVGLMYALLEIAEQIRTSPSPAEWFHSVPDTSESPSVPVRSMAVLLHSEDCEKDWYYSEKYWEDYFTLLASSRWNAFNLIFSHQTPYLSPLYAFHVDVEQHPEVMAAGLTDAQRMRNLRMLQHISAQAKAHGISFTLGIWQQIAWAGENQGSRQESMVNGLSRENMHSYTYHALLKLLKSCPDIDTVQLRINHESGIDYDEQTAFYRDSVFKAIQDCGRPVLLENRNVGLLRETIQASLDMGIPTRVSHKYWGEHMIFPYHPTRIMWTYSYGDWLKYPRTFRNLYQVWSLGSHRLLLWGDPQYVRRFAPTTLFQDAEGFEICAPLSQKGYGNLPGAWRIFKDRDREYYDWEYERYWSYYTLFGRLTYNPASADEIWLREIRHRFGEVPAPAVARAYVSASRIIPLIMGQATSDYNFGIWPEKDMGGLINFYLHLFSFDYLRISSFMDYVRSTLEGSTSAKLSPEDMAERLDRRAEECEAALAEAGGWIPADHKEYWATKKDFQILSGMARYHAQKIRAAYKLGLYYETDDLSGLQEAVAHAESGLEAWKHLSRAADEIYYDNLVLGSRSRGHWKDNLVFVENDVKQLRRQEELFRLFENFDYGFDFGPQPFTDVTTIYTPWYTNAYTVEHRFRGVYPHSYFDPQQGFGWNTDARVESVSPPEVNNSTWRGLNLSSLNFPDNVLMSDFIRGRGSCVFRIDLPEGHYQAALLFTDQSPAPADHGPMSVSVIERFGERPILVDAVIKKGETRMERFNFNMTGSRYSNFRLRFSSAPEKDFIITALTFTRIEPHIAHIPTRRALPGQDLILSVTVTLPPQVLQPVKDSLSIARGTTSTIDPPDKISEVRLSYSLDGGRSVKSVALNKGKSAIYTVKIPGEEIREGEILYSFEAADSIGQTVHSPSRVARGTNGFYRIKVSEDRIPPAIEHDPVETWEAGRDLPLGVKASDPSGIEKVLLYYRQTRQAMQYSVLSMEPDGTGGYSAVIPGDMISREFDLMYFFETVDAVGNGTFFPDQERTDPHLVVKIDR